MKPAELLEFSVDELEQKEQELREELFNLKIQHATGQLENTERVVQVRRDIARLKTIQRQRVLNKGEQHV